MPVTAIGPLLSLKNRLFQAPLLVPNGLRHSFRGKTAPEVEPVVLSNPAEAAQASGGDSPWVAAFGGVLSASEGNLEKSVNML